MPSSGTYSGTDMEVADRPTATYTSEFERTMVYDARRRRRVEEQAAADALAKQKEAFVSAATEVIGPVADDVAKIKEVLKDFAGGFRAMADQVTANRDAVLAVKQQLDDTIQWTSTIAQQMAVILQGDAITR